MEMVALTILFTSNLFLLPKALSLYLAGTTFPISSEYMSDVIRMNLLPVSVKSLRLYNACLAWEKSISKLANLNWFSTQWMDGEAVQGSSGLDLLLLFILLSSGAEWRPSCFDGFQLLAASLGLL